MLRLTLSVLFASFAAVGCAQQYTITKIEGLPGAVSISVAHVNDVGQAVGSVVMVNGTRVGFRWEQGTATNLGGFGPYTHPHAINNDGTIVGVTNSPPHESDSRAFIWKRETGLRLLFADRVASAAYGLNQAGEIVGRLGLNAFVLTANGLTLLEPTANEYGNRNARAINDTGQIIGSDYRYNSEWARPVIWTNGVISNLDGSAYHALGINNAGQVAGAYYDFYNDGIPVTWINRVRRELPMLTTIGGWAYAVNEWADIVGFCYEQGHQPRAVLWRNLEVIDLNERIGGGADWVLQHAFDINEKGQIVGSGLHKGLPSGFLLTPISRR